MEPYLRYSGKCFYGLCSTDVMLFHNRFFLSRDSCVGFQTFRFLFCFIPKLKVCGRLVVQWRKLNLVLSSDTIAAFAVN